MEPDTSVNEAVGEEMFTCGSWLFIGLLRVAGAGDEKGREFPFKSFTWNTSPYRQLAAIVKKLI